MRWGSQRILSRLVQIIFQARERVSPEYIIEQSILSNERRPLRSGLGCSRVLRHKHKSAGGRRPRFGSPCLILLIGIAYDSQKAAGLKAKSDADVKFKTKHRRSLSEENENNIAKIYEEGFDRKSYVEVYQQIRDDPSFDGAGVSSEMFDLATDICRCYADAKNGNQQPFAPLSKPLRSHPRKELMRRTLIQLKKYPQFKNNLPSESTVLKCYREYKEFYVNRIALDKVGINTKS